MFNKNKTHIENKAFMVEPFRDPTANECNIVIANDICIRVAVSPSEVFQPFSKNTNQ